MAKNTSITYFYFAFIAMSLSNEYIFIDTFLQSDDVILTKL